MGICSIADATCAYPIGALEPFFDRKAAAAELLAAEPLPFGRVIVGGMHACVFTDQVYERMRY